MDQSLGFLTHTLDLLLVILGFGLIIFLHELGHFLAAKWAGIRVLAFAIGFGPAAVSWRKGLGFRRGSSEREYQSLLGPEREGFNRSDPHAVSPTEYRFNWLPFGGYVKMLGQEDTNPQAVSDAPDSYQNTPIWKRMVVISAGVVFNLITAAVLFIAVFLHGLEMEPAVIGLVSPGSPASRATAVNDRDVEPGLRPGDRVLSIDGRRARPFNDLVLASAMSGRGEAMDVRIERPGAPEPLDFQVRPEPGSQSRLLEIGVAPALSATIAVPQSAEDRAALVDILKQDGLVGVEPGMTLVSAAGKPVTDGAADLVLAARESNGAPIPLVFRAKDGRAVNVTIKPHAELQTAEVRMPSGAMAGFDHLLGLTPVLQVDGPTDEGGPKQGLKVDDLFARVGDVAYPSLPAGIAEIKRHHGQQIPVTVLRRSASGALEPVTINPPPTVNDISGGQIGFLAGEDQDTNIVALPPVPAGEGERQLPAASIITESGTRIVAVAGKPVSTLTDIRAALRDATAEAAAHSGRAGVPITEQLPSGDAGAWTAPREVMWELSASDIRALHELKWTPGIRLAVFEPAEKLVRAEGPNIVARSADAIGMGLSETKRVMVTTYVTFARLFEGTVKVEHLKGPVGIAHMGTQVASRGMTWLLFFMALISVNLAVVNFLPLPIVDGGQFLFLILEQVRGKPLSIEIQNIATIAGLLLIGTMFLIVTFNDIVHLFG